MPAVGELVRCTNGSWMVRPPERCPRGQQLRAHRVLIDHPPCSCVGGHTSWTCLECGATVYGPPLRVSCRPRRPGLSDRRPSSNSSIGAVVGMEPLPSRTCAGHGSQVKAEINAQRSAVDLAGHSRRGLRSQPMQFSFHSGAFKEPQARRIVPRPAKIERRSHEHWPRGRGENTGRVNRRTAGLRRHGGPGA